MSKPSIPYLAVAGPYLAVAGVLLGAACFDAEGLRGAPCIDDADCGPKLLCIGAEGARACGGGDSPLVGGRWPDSTTFECTDGSVSLTSCPEPGNVGYGQDGNYQIAVPSYATSDGIVHDSVTELDWESASTSEELSQTAALERCNNLQLDGRNWRLPSRLELVSLLDFGGELAFDGLYNGAHWSSSDAADSGQAWVIDFLSRSTVVYASTDPAFVICVTGEPLVSAFSTTSDTIRDGLSGYEWQRATHSQTLTWTDALNHCEGLTLAERSDWRLPSAKELLTLTRDDQQPVTGLDGASETSWTSTPGWPPDHAVVVRLPSGTTSADLTTVPNDLHCVRGPD